MKIVFDLNIQLYHSEARVLAQNLAAIPSDKNCVTLWDNAQSGFVIYDGDKQIGIVKPE